MQLSSLLVISLTVFLQMLPFYCTSELLCSLNVSYFLCLILVSLYLGELYLERFSQCFSKLLILHSIVSHLILSTVMFIFTKILTCFFSIFLLLLHNFLFLVHGYYSLLFLFEDCYNYFKVQIHLLSSLFRCKLSSLEMTFLIFSIIAFCEFVSFGNCCKVEIFHLEI